MRSLNCFYSPWRRKKDKGVKKSIKPADSEKTIKSLHIDLEHLQKTSETELGLTSFSVPVPLPGSSRCKVKVMNHESPVAAESGEVDYEAEDEHDEMKRDNSEFSFQTHARNSTEEKYQTVEGTNSPCWPDIDYDEFMHDKIRSSNTEEGLEMITSGHVSDPGMETAEFSASPKLKRSCSNLAMRSMWGELDDQFYPRKCKSYEEMPRSTEMFGDEVLVGDGTTSVSGRSLSSADKVIMKKHSSRQILPSRSRRLWRILFLWSHRNLNRARTAKPQPVEIKPSALVDQAGYSSDAIEPRQAMDSISTGKDSSHFTRVNEWVKEVSSQPSFQVGIDDQTEDGVLFSPSPENRSWTESYTSISHFSSLRSVNLSNNFIGLSCCTLIKELYLSGNKISNVEGLHRLLKLTVLDLSFNKITTAKALGQLVANYHTLIALNLLGNPIQGNISNDQLRKTLCSLLPKLVLLNKQPITAQKAREIRADANAKAALGTNSWSSRRKSFKSMVSQGSSSSHSMRRSSSLGTGQKTKQKSKGRPHHRPALKDKA
ncbi:UNVERIFIED_CONTAM: hypothetical protein Sangu_3109900 [Sesamum angustifolium]|uniref:Outer arm dynein light chain 1 protein n=1 Tax=Sesamum angustifolium TaxID=2727405 RepID=A0AAW2K5T8_9LAMI